MKILHRPYFWLGLIVVLAAFLRFYRVEEYLRFLGDEGRDVLVVKHMLEGKWTLLGPTASVGGFYIGPIYYYFMLPFLWLFKLNPVGPAYMAGLFGLGLVILTYFAVKKFFDEKIALLAAFFAAISPKLIEMYRFSWNPNPMPFFALLTIYLLYLGFDKNKKIFIVGAGISFGVMLQLHYIDFAFAPVAGVIILILFPWRSWLANLFIFGLGTILGNSLFLIFEFRHGFPNLNSVWEFMTRNSAPVAPRQLNPVFLFDDVARQMFDGYLGFAGKISEGIYHLSLLGFLAYVIKNRGRKLIILVAWLVIGVLGVGFYRGQLYPHYFGYLFTLPAIMLAVSVSWLWKKKILLPVAVIAIAVVSGFQIQKWFIWQKPNNLVTQVKTTDEIISGLIGDQPYNFALIAPGNSDHGYRYFLEVLGKSPTIIDPPQKDPDRKTVTGQLVVVCEIKDCRIFGNPSWEIAGCGDGRISDSINGPAGIKIYKLVK